MELNLTRDQVIAGQTEFIHFISNDFNKQLIIKTIENCVNDKDWPMSYYNLRNDYLPNLVGENAAKYFFWVVFGGSFNSEIDFEFENVEVDLMNFVILNYSTKFIRAKKYNINPLGYDSIHFTFGPENDRVNTYIKRNDEEQFILRMNPYEFTDMLNESLEYFSNMVNDDVLEYKEDKEFILENVESIKSWIDQLETKLKAEGQ
ncbi:hypothetical protein G3M81_17895 [Bacillus paralicheniformis]|uniref:hypothetical protein n=1 Tax=Bacillus paralicheniformis TaxID=1648923 RepID=UPI0013EF28C3|nr:hypothetical protein [Bacillus paralicheniformis]QII50485.1 hypothetical protein G3M81_17895 [Bacillus paralicheniformis]